MNAIVIVSLLACAPGAHPEPDGGYRAALVAAALRFAEDGEAGHLAAILDKHPKLVNAKRTFPQPRKPMRTDDFTALHFAAERGREEAVAYLIKRGAEVKATAGLDWTPLHLAAEAGHLAAVKRLVEGGAEVGAKTAAVRESFGVPPSSGPGEVPRKLPGIPSRTALELARGKGHAAVVEYLKGRR